MVLMNQRVVSSVKEGDNWLKHQLSRRGVKYTRVNSLVFSMATACKDDTAQTVLWLKAQVHTKVKQ